MLVFGWRGRPSLARVLVGCAVIAVIWIVIYGVQGYSLGHPPPGPVGTIACFRTAKIDFVIPMYKPIAPVNCDH